MMREQRAHLGLERRVARAGLREIDIASLGRLGERRLEDLGDPRPALGHAAPPYSSRCSQARATVQSRFTVAGEVPSTSAVSSIDKPA
jgi:hypothetical protein